MLKNKITRNKETMLKNVMVGKLVNSDLICLNSVNKKLIKSKINDFFLVYNPNE